MLESALAVKVDADACPKGVLREGSLLSISTARLAPQAFTFLGKADNAEVICDMGQTLIARVQA